MSEAIDKYEAARQRLRDLGCTGFNITIRDPSVDPDLIAEDAVKHLEFIEKCIEDKEFRDENTVSFSDKFGNDEEYTDTLFGTKMRDKVKKRSTEDWKEAGRKAGEALKNI